MHWRIVATAALLTTACGDDAGRGKGRGPRHGDAPPPSATRADPTARRGWGPGGSANAVAAEDEPEADRGDCPPGTQRIGNSPPQGFREFCVEPQESGPPLRQGHYREWHPGGDRKIVGQFTDGDKTGTWIEYYPGDQEKERSEFTRDVLDGAWIEWFPTGQKKGEGRYREGKKHGRARFWHENGQLKADSNYEDDLRQGRSINWYESGSIWSQGSYVDGKKEGPWVDYNEQGEAFHSNYRDGVKLQ